MPTARRSAPEDTGSQGHAGCSFEPGQYGPKHGRTDQKVGLADVDTPLVIARAARTGVLLSNPNRRSASYQRNDSITGTDWSGVRP